MEYVIRYAMVVTAAMGLALGPGVFWLSRSASAEKNAGVQFADVTLEAGVAFRNWFGDNDTKTILETTGTGAAFFDYDNDGDVDLYIVNGRAGFDLPRYQALSHDVEPPPDGEEPRNALFGNNGDGTFTDVTVQAGVHRTGWGQGCAAADYDNDGDLDLYLTYYGSNVLYQNNGDGTFTDVTASAGVGGGIQYWTACGFGDYDNDGDLDLFVGNYVPFDPETDPLPGSGPGTMTRGIPTSLAPEAYPGAPDILYRNNGDGTFTDVSSAAGLNSTLGRALDAVFWDYDNDGDQDLYVANDAMANFLYTNHGDGTFSEEGLMKGVAYGEGGVEEGSMGISVGDYDNDGYQDLLVASYEEQTTTLYHNEEGFFFSDVSLMSGIGKDTLGLLQWGAIFFDYDSDGDEDIFMASGHITSALEKDYPQSPFAQTDQLFRNENGAFVNVTSISGSGLQRVKSGRGAVAGDYDNDGDLDLFIVNKNDLPTLLRNDGGNRNHWLTIRTIGTQSNRDGIGAKVRLVLGDRSQTKEVRSGSSYLSQNDMRVSFGLGDHTVADTLEIRWPSRLVQVFENVKGDRFLRVIEGKGLEEL